MKTIHIITSHFLNNDNSIRIGGLETYTYRLALLLSNNRFRVIVYEYRDYYEEINYDDFTVIRIKGQSSKDIIKFIDISTHDYKNDILIFSTDYLICKNPFKNSIAIQHGISWDLARQSKVPFIYRFISITKSALRSAKKIVKFRHCNNIICVDYNFLNWYRTQLRFINERIYVIPNFADCPPEKPLKNDKQISLIFARRLYEYRGTRLFTEAVKKVISKYPNISITIAGTGPDENWMREQLNSFPQVKFTTYESKDSILVHAQHDIAVVPTLGSEGTSLSLLEAMAAGCAVVATNIGGMTNIILDGYNGLLINPEEKILEEAICDLISNEDKRKQLATNAYVTVKEAFSYEKWSQKWLEVINSITNLD